MLLKGFFSANPFNPEPYWNGAVLFESSTPGTHTYTLQHSVKCGIICVAGGAGGFSAKAGLKINEGAPDEQIYSGLVASSGGSGGHSYIEQDFVAGTQLTIRIGQGGTGYASTSLYGTVSQSHPILSLGDSTIHGGYSDVSDGNSIIIDADSVISGTMRLTTPSDPSTLTFLKSHGGVGSVHWGHDGSIVGDNITDVSLSGGTSVYNGYGAGGNAGWSGDNQSGTPFVSNGGNGYVKIFVIAPD